MNGKLAVADGAFQLLQELAAIDLLQDADVEEEVRPAAAPLEAVGAEPSAGDDAVHVRVIEQGLGPGVEDGEEADPGLQPALRDLEQGLRSGLEQRAVRDLAGGEEQPVQLLRKREHDVEVRDRQEVGGPLLDPVGLPQPMALRAVPVLTGVVDGERPVAPGASVEVASQRRGAAGGDGVHDLRLVRPQRELVTVRAEERREVELGPVATSDQRGGDRGRDRVSRRREGRRG